MCFNHFYAMLTLIKRCTFSFKMYYLKGKRTKKVVLSQMSSSLQIIKQSLFLRNIDNQQLMQRKTCPGDNKIFKKKKKLFGYSLDVNPCSVVFVLLLSPRLSRLKCIMKVSFQGCLFFRLIFNDWRGGDEGNFFILFINW